MYDPGTYNPIMERCADCGHVFTEEDRDKRFGRYEDYVCHKCALPTDRPISAEVPI